MKIRIHNRRFPVRLLDADDLTDAWGTFYPSDGIDLAVDQPPAMMASTLLHEVLHACWHTAGLQPQVDEETAVAGLEGPLLDFIVKNPRLVSALRNAVKLGTPLKIAEAE